jgi:hypothetical protein
MLAGIHVARVRDVAILNYVLRDAGAKASLSRRLAGIQVVSCTRARVAGNRVINLGPMEAQLRDADAIAVLGLCEHADVADNVVQRQETPPGGGQDPSLSRGVRIGPENERPLLVGNFWCGRRRSRRCSPARGPPSACSPRRPPTCVGTPSPPSALRRPC